MAKMNLDKWYDRAKVKVEKMSPRMMLAMLDAIDNRIDQETGIEVIHIDIKGELMQEIADHYDIEIE